MKASLPPGLIVRELNAEDSIPEITALLHEAYAPLAAMGLLFSASHQDDDATAQRLRAGYALIAELEEVIIGTVTLYPPNSEHVCEWYRQPQVFRFGQFAVSPSLQRCGIGSHLMQLVEHHARRLGARELALDTAEGATHLRRWYEATGFCFVQFIEWHDTNYRSVVLSKRLEPDVAVNQEHLAIVRRRKAEIDSGAVEAVPGDVAAADVRRALQQVRRQ